MDYQFNLSCLKKKLISNTAGYHCGYRIRTRSITRSSKRINQLINHSEILFGELIKENKFNTEQLRNLRHVYALGLSNIARDKPDIQDILKQKINGSQQKIFNAIEYLRSINLTGNEAILMETVIKILSIGAAAGC